MRRQILLYTLLISVIPTFLYAQQGEYRKNGDEAMARGDYAEARMWYEEGISDCNMYSIDKLITISLLSEDMRPSMRSVMDRCLNCLTPRATNNDTLAIKKLIIIYEEKLSSFGDNQNMSSYWHEQLNAAKRTNHYEQAPMVKKRGRVMKFFVGYNYSVLSPVGITIGGVANRFGWYGRFKTNASGLSSSYECNDLEEILNFTNGSYKRIKPKSKMKTYTGTVGMLFKVFPNFYLGAGAGYGTTDVFWNYEVYNDDGVSVKDNISARNIDSSYKGVAVDLDMMYRFGAFYISLGATTLSFKDLDLNANVGVFF